MKRIIENGKTTGIEFEEGYKEIYNDFGNGERLLVEVNSGMFSDFDDYEDNKAVCIKNPLYISITDKDEKMLSINLSYEDAVELQRYIGEVLAMADSARERYIAELEATINDLKQQSHD
jgi:hypothetical protein